MALQPGTTLLHFRLVEPIGEGGMGVVWKALDTTLDREVAIKVLPEAFVADAERLQRFEREAKLLASLNHPNIATIFGLHQADGTRFLTMELLAGESLDARIARGPLPIREALEIAAEVATALEAAHEQDVVHRDLKPANIQLDLDGRVKVLDFGLAKSVPRTRGMSDPPTDVALDATRTSAGTRVGMVLGTPGYMSPEQARGKPVDRRTDIWAFGCVLLEMLTGECAFGGETVSDSIAKILERDAPLGDLPATAPASIHRLLRRCLEKDPRRRQRDIGDALLVIEDALQGREDEPTAREEARPTRSGWQLAIALAVVGIALGAAVMYALRPKPAPPEIRRFRIAVNDLSRRMTGAFFPSPDGRSVAYLAGERIRVRDFDDLIPRSIGPDEPLDGTTLFWSPDGTYIGYQHDGKLWKASVVGGRTESICALPETGMIIDAAWSSDGQIVFSAWRGSLYSVPAGGGIPTVLLEADHEDIVDFHRVEWLPDGTLLLTGHAAEEGSESWNGVIFLRDGQVHRLDLGRRGMRVPTYSATGHLLYNIEDGDDIVLEAVPFSLAKLEPTGDPVRLATHAASPRVTPNGLLLYGQILPRDREERLAWVGRDGTVLESLGASAGCVSSPRLSADERQIIMGRCLEQDAVLHVYHPERKTMTRLTFDEGDLSGESGDRRPNWSTDGTEIYFSRHFNLRSQSFAIASDGGGKLRELFAGEDIEFAPDGRSVVFGVPELDADFDVWIADVGADGRIDSESRRPLLASDWLERAPAISPNGSFVAYQAGVADDLDIYMSRFPSGEGRWQISTDSGWRPRWNADGTKLYFGTNDGEFFEVAVRTDPYVEIGVPERLFSFREKQLDQYAGYDVARDGRFLMVERLPGADSDRSYVVVVENWTELLDAR